MNKRLLSLALCGGLLLGLAGCHREPVNLLEGVSPEPGTVSAGEPEGWTAAVNGFALRLLQEGAPGAENTLISPISLLAGLGMVMNGAAGRTLEEMETALALTGGEINGYFSRLAADPPEEISLANALWIRNDPALTVNREFLRKTAGGGSAGVFTGDFDSQTVDSANAWVKKKTSGQIEGIVEEFPDSAMLCLLNALTFDARWMEPYEKDTEIRQGIFTAASGKEQPAEFLCGSEVYLKNGECSGFFKPYQGERYAFAALLPEEGISLDQFVADLTAEKLAELFAEPAGYIQAAFPKFEAEYAGEMKPFLSAMGMDGAFRPGADFSAMASYGPQGESLYLGKVSHRTAIAVGEQGTRAGAVTEADMYVSSAPPAPSLWLNRPFLYLILDVETCTPLFIGTLVELGA